MNEFQMEEELMGMEFRLGTDELHLIEDDYWYDEPQGMKVLDFEGAENVCVPELGDDEGMVFHLEDSGEDEGTGFGYQDVNNR